MTIPVKKTGAIIIEGHVQGLSNTRSLGEAGIPVFVVDVNNCIARYSRYCRAFFKCPPFYEDALADFLIRLAADYGIQDWLLLPSNDHAVVTLSRNKERLEKYFKVITPGLTIIKNIYDKSKIIDIAAKAGVPVPDTFYASDTGATGISLTYPVLTRGRFGIDFYRATGRKAFPAGNIRELRSSFLSLQRGIPYRTP